MPLSVRVRLSLLMFLTYVVWGCWFVTIGTYLTATLKFTGTQTGAVFGTTALASMISPLLVGLVADRFFASERVLAALHALAAVFLYLVSQATDFGTVYLLMLANCLCFFPTLSLANSLTLRHVTDAKAQFPIIRLFATIGHIVITNIIGWLAIEADASQFQLASVMSVALALFCLMLPHTPPASSAGNTSWRRLIGLDALVMLKNRPYLIFLIASALACIPLTFYFSFTNAYLNALGIANAAGKMSLGQVSEVVMLLLMPLIFRRVSIKGILLMGLLAWALRYLFLAFGNSGDGMWMFYAAILLHGICFDFFFITGQLYTDAEAPANLRGTAQGLLTFMTFGVGMFAGSLLSGRAVDYFTTTVNGVVNRNWQGFWLSSSIGAACIFLLMAVLFRSRTAQAPAAAPAVSGD